MRDVRILIETAFWASLKREEERPVTFNIALLPRSDVANEIDFGSFGQVLLTFNQSLPMTVESITKLAVAFDPKTTAFVAAPVDDERTEYEIWGAIFFGYPRNQFKEIALSEAGLRFLLRPDC